MRWRYARGAGAVKNKPTVNVGIPKNFAFNMRQRTCRKIFREPFPHSFLTAPLIAPGLAQNMSAAHKKNQARGVTHHAS
jgi:hypothetical protein